MRPTYAMLLRHAWLAPLMKPPTISEDEEAEAAAEAGADTSSLGVTASQAESADKEVADWVCSAIERKLSGKMSTSEKPALHAAPLDAVPGSPLLDRQAVKLSTPPITTSDQSHTSPRANGVQTAANSTTDPEPRDGITVDNSQLRFQKVHSMDFADDVAQSTGSAETDGWEEGKAQTPSISLSGGVKENMDVG
jgi:hypothetical protein